jgi:hypothetical protein
MKFRKNEKLHDRQTCRLTGICALPGRQWYRKAGRNTIRSADIHADVLAGRQGDRHTDKPRENKAEVGADRSADSQAKVKHAHDTLAGKHTDSRGKQTGIVASSLKNGYLDIFTDRHENIK